MYNNFSKYSYSIVYPQFLVDGELLRNLTTYTNLHKRVCMKVCLLLSHVKMSERIGIQFGTGVD